MSSTLQFLNWNCHRVRDTWWITSPRLSCTESVFKYEVAIIVIRLVTPFTQALKTCLYVKLGLCGCLTTVIARHWFHCCHWQLLGVNVSQLSRVKV